MHSIIDGFSPIGAPAWRTWDGMLADLWTVDGLSGARGEYVSPHARLFVMLGEADQAPIHLSETPTRTGPSRGRISYVPPGVHIWSFLPAHTRLRHLDLHVDLDRLQDRLAARVPAQILNQPRLMFEDDRILALATALAEDIAGPGLHDQFASSLGLAIWVRLFQVPRTEAAKAGTLSPSRLRVATQYLTENALFAVRLEDVARLTGLSTSHFCSAFKASTGLTPHQWRMQVRLRQVKTLLRAQDTSLSDIAAACGFVDQAHMTRVFKQYCGITPAAWQRSGPFA